MIDTFMLSNYDCMLTDQYYMNEWENVSFTAVSSSVEGNRAEAVKPQTSTQICGAVGQGGSWSKDFSADRQGESWTHDNTVSQIY